MNPVFTIIEYVINLFAMVFLLRVLLQLGSADFFNPIAQFIHKFTAPVINPLRSVLPDIGKFNLAGFVFALALLTGKIFVFKYYFLSQADASMLTTPVMLFLILVGLGPISGLFMVISNLLLILFIGLMIASFMSGGRYNPGLIFLAQVTRPILRPIQKIIPPLGGTIDLSPMIVLLGLFFLQSALYNFGVSLLSQ
ncbi:YggT family protein [Kangiella profundi]|uniref:YggT family protein n=1 Tax=Kangiella profundi TaxID=1561924 RepID=A0A2K9AFY8_9GAMM|nr:YggT family protein [Kangiella profundi]AUD77854.1 YggT family protein [Kangiella profundi]GGE91959.1 membrane protein [Kangiella profundi]